MADASRPGSLSQGLSLDASLTIDRVENGTTVGNIAISTQRDGCLKIATSGRLTTELSISSLREMRQAREGLTAIAHATQQNVTVEREGRSLLTVQPSSSDMAKVSVSWIAVLRLWIEGLVARR